MVEDRGPEVSGVATAFLILSWIIILLRGYCRLCIVKSVGTDDYLALAAQIFFTLFCAFAIGGVRYGTGMHAIDIQPPSNIPEGLKWWWACEPIYVLCNLFLKFSIGIFLLRIAILKTHRIALWTVMAVTGVINTYYFFLFIFQCYPPAYFWGQYTGMDGSCINTKYIVDSTYAYSAVSCWADWTMCLLPSLIVWRLQMNLRTKLSVCMLLALGAIASIATIVRFPYINGLTDVDDFLYATTDVAIWSISETGLGIMASSGATLRPLFKTFLGRSRSDGAGAGIGLYPSDTPTPHWTPGRSTAAGYFRSTSRASTNGAVVTARVAGDREQRQRQNDKRGHAREEDEEEIIGLRTYVGKFGGITRTTVTSIGLEKREGSVDSESGSCESGGHRVRM